MAEEIIRDSGASWGFDFSPRRVLVRDEKVVEVEVGWQGGVEWLDGRPEELSERDYSEWGPEWEYP